MRLLWRGWEWWGHHMQTVPASTYSQAFRITKVSKQKWSWRRTQKVSHDEAFYLLVCLSSLATRVLSSYSSSSPLSLLLWSFSHLCWPDGWATKLTTSRMVFTSSSLFPNWSSSFFSKTWVWDTSASNCLSAECSFNMGSITCPAFLSLTASTHYLCLWGCYKQPLQLRWQGPSCNNLAVRIMFEPCQPWLSSLRTTMNIAFSIIHCWLGPKL